ncbi:MAG: Uncharacterised protein [Hyphomonas sp. TMED17]|nr:MAG: Uncharacterised protein [Hyphomonas sp. TMED17]
MTDQERPCSFCFTNDVVEMDGQSINFGDKLRVSVKLGFSLSPVIGVKPMCLNVFECGRRHAIAPGLVMPGRLEPFIGCDPRHNLPDFVIRHINLIGFDVDHRGTPCRFVKRAGFRDDVKSVVRPSLWQVAERAMMLSERSRREALLECIK